MRDYAMFWGCTIPARFPSIEKATRLVLDDLGVRIHELDGHTCCPEATLVKAVDPDAYHVVAARNLAIVGRSGLDLVTPCNGCYSTFKETQRHLSATPAERADVDGQLADRGPGLAPEPAGPAPRRVAGRRGGRARRRPARRAQPGRHARGRALRLPPAAAAAGGQLGRPAAAVQGRDAGPRARRARRRLPVQDAVLRRRARPRRPARDARCPWRAPSCSSWASASVDALVVVCPELLPAVRPQPGRAAARRRGRGRARALPVRAARPVLRARRRPTSGSACTASPWTPSSRRGTSATPAATGRASRSTCGCSRSATPAAPAATTARWRRWTRSSGPTRSSAGSSTATSRACWPTARPGSASSASPAWSSAPRASGWPRRCGCSRSTPPRGTASRTRCARPTTCSPATACWASRASPRAASSACRRSPPPAARRSRACSPAADSPERPSPPDGAGCGDDDLCVAAPAAASEEAG